MANFGRGNSPSLEAALSSLCDLARDADKRKIIIAKVRAALHVVTAALFL